MDLASMLMMLKLIGAALVISNQLIQLTRNLNLF